MTSITFNAVISANPTIFLDIDGVLLKIIWACYDDHPRAKEYVDSRVREYVKKHGNVRDYAYEDSRLRDLAAVENFDQDALKNLHSLIKRLDNKVDIVISSCWRLGRSVRDLKELLTPISDFIKGKTRDSAVVRRAGEIKEYIKEHPEILNYVVIDDTDNDGSLKEEFDDKFIHVDYKKRFTEADEKKAFDVITKQQKVEKSEIKRINELDEMTTLPGFYTTIIPSSLSSHLETIS